MTDTKGRYNMSHQILISFDIDENRVQENAEREAGRQIAKQIIDSAFGQSYSRERLLAQYVTDAIEAILEPERNRIIKEAVEELVSRISRTKQVKDAGAERLNAGD